ncbi:MAG: DUF2306 domain-containing protein [Paracoccaceae bacterium]|nr:DUF2306 domain-containing protein [Paracoccaceae bacterium]
MEIGVLFQHGWVISAHALAALAALVLGGAQLALPKGTARHRTVGRIWIVLMAFIALSSFAIFSIRLVGPFSPIHLLSVLVLVTLVQVVRNAQRGDIARHTTAVQRLYWLALIGAGLFTLWPGRVMHQVVFGT